LPKKIIAVDHELASDFARHMKSSTPAEVIKTGLDDLDNLRTRDFQKLLENCSNSLLDKADSRNGALAKIPPENRLTVVGDLHGDMDALLDVLTGSGFYHNRDHRIIFLGDYGDRGRDQIGTYYLLLLLLSHFPEKVTLLRGNHEAPREMPFHPHDLPDKLRWTFGSKGNEVKEQIYDLYDSLPIAAIVPGHYLMLHGGPPSDTIDEDEIALAPKRHPQTKVFEEILWNDPDEEINGTAPNTRRGVGKIFGKEVTNRILKAFSVSSIIRAHEASPGKVNHEGRVLTVFCSKAPYHLRQGAYITVDFADPPLQGESLSEHLTWF